LKRLARLLAKLNEEDLREIFDKQLVDSEEMNAGNGFI